jgi:hypothetical protein
MNDGFLRRESQITLGILPVWKPGTLRSVNVCTRMHETAAAETDDQDSDLYQGGEVARVPSRALETRDAQS